MILMKTTVLKTPYDGDYGEYDVPVASIDVLDRSPNMVTMVMV